MSGVRLADVVPLHLAEVTYPEGHPLAGSDGVVFGYAVRHTQGVFVFDTGVGTGDAWVDAHYRPRVRRVEEALGAAAIALGDVVAVANSHLHFDHAGQNARFAGIPIYVQAAERQAARVTGYTVSAWIEFPGARYEELAGDSEPLPGIRLLATPGHTPGHQSAVVATSEGDVVLAGQAVYSLGEWRGEARSEDPSSRTAASARRLRALGARQVYFAHDAARWQAT